jgi:hypothetical protein
MALEQLNDLFEHLIEVHHQPPGVWYDNSCLTTVAYISRTANRTPSLMEQEELGRNHQAARSDTTRENMSGISIGSTIARRCLWDRLTTITRREHTLSEFLQQPFRVL